MPGGFTAAAAGRTWPGATDRSPHARRGAPDYFAPGAYQSSRVSGRPQRPSSGFASSDW
jgi:hypothetical protein